MLRYCLSVLVVLVGVLLIVGAGVVSADDPPIGSIVMWGTDTAPDGWLLCDGTAIIRTTYADLFNVIGTTFGVGDGSTTFNLPNFDGRSPQGTDIDDEMADVIGLKMQTDVPQHRHYLYLGSGSTAVDMPQAGRTYAYGGYTGYTGVAGGVDQRGPRLAVNFIIKYADSGGGGTPTPTPTPTPDPLVITNTLESGNVWALKREVTYGNASVVVGLIVLAGIEALILINRVVRR